MTDRPPLRKIVFMNEHEDDHHARLREAFPDVTMVFAPGDDLVTAVPDAQLVVGGPVPDDVVAAAESLVWLHVPYAGVERVITPALASRGVVITNSRGVSAPNMAEHVIALMLALGRALPTFFQQQEKHVWRDWQDRPTFFELTGQTAVLLGIGAIGQAIATRLRGFGMEIIGARRHASGDANPGFDQIVPFSELANVLPRADHVVSSLPMTHATAGIVSEAMIASMKPGAYFYNVGRGGTVDQDALIAALQSGHLAGAGLDVTSPEPLPADSDLWDLPNVIITAHTSGTSPKAAARAYDVLAENIRRYQDGRELFNVVDTEWGY
jgi:D-2-hydroxyacid dehydrogenase (NADP+)